MDRPDTDPLVIGLAAGDERVFAILYDRFAARMYRTAVRMLHSREDAEDVVQDVFASTVRSHKKLGEVRDLTAYLFVSLRRAAGQCALRRIQSAQAAAAAANERTREKNATIADHDHCDRLQEAIDALPEEQREVLTLKIDGELTFSQIANVMGGTVSTAASRYQYALRKLRSSLAGANPSLEKTS